MEMKKEHKERAEEIREKTTLPERESEVYVLRFEEGKKHQDVATILGIKEGNARKYAGRIKKRVKEAEKLKEKYENTANLL
jgi:RNA polymerase sigma factor (sigma-70 family)